jgi:thiamine monophosphate kinase
LVLGGGEEYLIVGTVSQARFESARRASIAAGADLLPIGHVTHGPVGVSLRQDGSVKPVERIGWTHLN